MIFYRCRKLLSVCSLLVFIGCGTQVEKTSTRLKGFDNGVEADSQQRKNVEAKASAKETLESLYPRIEELVRSEAGKGKILAEIVNSGLSHLNGLGLTGGQHQGYCLLISGKDPFSISESSAIELSSSKLVIKSSTIYQANQCSGFFKSSFSQDQSIDLSSPDLLMSFFPVM